MVTEKQIAANRQNAQRSTGPKSDAGKQHSRANALTHGLAGTGAVLPEQDRVSYQAKLEAYRLELGAEGELENDLLGRVALAAVRLEKCRRLEEARSADRRRKAKAGWEAKRKIELDALIGQLGRDPAAVLARMMEMSIGCDWLISAWEQLEGDLVEFGCWGPEALEFAIFLNGRRPDGGPSADPLAMQLMLWNRALQPEQSYQSVRAGALAELREHIAKTLLALEERRVELLHVAEPQELAEELESIQVDTSLEATRLLRYENAADQSLHRNLNRLIKIRLAETEHLSVKRWLKMGQQCARIWNGTAWVPAPGTYGTSTTPGWGSPAENIEPQADLRNEPNPEAQADVAEEVKAVAEAPPRSCYEAASVAQERGEAVSGPNPAGGQETEGPQSATSTAG